MTHGWVPKNLKAENLMSDPNFEYDLETVFRCVAYQFSNNSFDSQTAKEKRMVSHKNGTVGDRFQINLRIGALKTPNRSQPANDHLDLHYIVPAGKSQQLLPASDHAKMSPEIAARFHDLPIQCFVATL